MDSILTGFYFNNLEQTKSEAALYLESPVPKQLTTDFRRLLSCA